MEKNKLKVAAAGSGKTTYLVEEALKIDSENVLITTFTNNNEEEIKKKIISIKGCVPNNITVLPWYSFLLQHGARPYQGGVFQHRITGINLISGRSTKGIKESDVEKFYFDRGHRAYPDKLPKFVLKCNKQTNGRVIDRISKIFPHIFIDEFQDLAAYDLDVLKLLFDSLSSILLVGDPRQSVYSTNQSKRYEKYRGMNILNFFEKEVENIDIDKESFTKNRRSNAAICNFSNKLFPEYGNTTSEQTEETGHDGVFLLREDDIDHYLNEYANCVQLFFKNSSAMDQKLKSGYQSMTFGKAKGLSFDRVLIFPTKKIIDWLIDHDVNLSPETRCKFYVAITRARHSVAIVCNENKYNAINNNSIERWGLGGLSQKQVELW